jgi:hypothetical protein
MQKVIDRTKELMGFDNDRSGWVMSEILKTIESEFDADMADVARTYIIKEHCKITEN